MHIYLISRDPGLKSALTLGREARNKCGEGGYIYLRSSRECDERVHKYPIEDKHVYRSKDPLLYKDIKSDDISVHDFTIDEEIEAKRILEIYGEEVAGNKILAVELPVSKSRKLTIKHYNNIDEPFKEIPRAVAPREYGPKIEKA